MWENIIKAKDDYGDSTQPIQEQLMRAMDNTFALANKVADAVEKLNPDLPSDEQALLSLDRLTTLFMDFEDDLLRWVGAFGG